MESPIQGIGKFLIIGGVIILLIGVIFYFADKIPGIGRLPGDILVNKKNFTFYFPLTTSIILSILLSLGLYLIRKLF